MLSYPLLLLLMILVVRFRAGKEDMAFLNSSARGLVVVSNIFPYQQSPLLRSFPPSSPMRPLPRLPTPLSTNISSSSASKRA